MSEFDLLAAEMIAVSTQAKRKVRGALGRGADDIRDTAQGLGRSKGWSSETVDGIYSRMARGTAGDPTAYVFGTGPMAYQETGTVRHPPNPVLGPALDQHADGIVEAVADAIADIF